MNKITLSIAPALLLLMVGVTLAQNPTPADYVFDESGHGYININNTGWQVLPVTHDPLNFGALTYGPFHQPVVPGVLGILEGQGSHSGELSDTVEDIQILPNAQGPCQQGPCQVLRFLSDQNPSEQELADLDTQPHLPTPRSL